MRIKSITISGQGSIGREPVNLELGPRTVLIGPHGAGKGTVIMALHTEQTLSGEVEWDGV